MGQYYEIKINDEGKCLAIKHNTEKFYILYQADNLVYEQIDVITGSMVHITTVPELPLTLDFLSFKGVIDLD